MSHPALPFGGRPVSDAERRENDRHDYRVVLLVLATLSGVAYLWSDWMVRLPLPGIAWLGNHSWLKWSFPEGHFAEQVWIDPRAVPLADQPQRLLVLGLAAVGFLFAYYLPPRIKKIPLVLLALLGIGWAFGPRALAALLGTHGIAFLTFHPTTRRAVTVPLSTTVAASAALFFLTPGTEWAKPGQLILASAVGAPAVYLIYSQLYRRLLRTSARPVLQACVAHSSVIYLFLGVAWNAATDSILFLPLGLVLFFWQWERLIFYYVDLCNDRVPRDLSPWEYFATFFNPAFLVNFNWIVSIGKGYSYVHNSFLARDKNRIVLSGLKLIALSVLAFFLRPQILLLIASVFRKLGATVYDSFFDMLTVLAAGEPLGFLSAWSGLTLEFFSFYLLWTGVAHLKVGLWRLFGYDLEPYFQAPFLSTNLVALWRRYTFYYREFLLHAFYYPVFFRFFKKRPLVRTFVATMAAAGFGNFVYGHMVEGFLYEGATVAELLSQLRTIPFFVLFGTAIGAVAVFMQLRGRRARRPWTGGWRTATDVASMLLTFGAFMIIRMFRVGPVHFELGDCVRLALIALGIPA